MSVSLRRIDSRSAGALSSILALIACVAAAPAAAGDILVTSGSLTLSPSSGAVVIAGDRGLSINGQVSAYAGRFILHENCNMLDGPCAPGDLIGLGALWSGTDAPGTFTLDGVTYTNSSGMSSVRLAFDGSLVLPPMAPSAEVVAPFVFSGGVSSLGISERLFGSGVVTVSLVPHATVPGRWRLSSATYAFGGRVPAPWVASDIGSVGTPGFASALGQQFVLNGNGSDIWGTADAFHFVHQAAPGDVSVAARVRYQQDTHQYAKAGLMVRESLSPSSPHVVLDVKPDGGLEFMVRYAPGEATTYLGGGPSGGNVFIRLARRGSTIVGAWSVDGVRWTEVGRVTLVFATDEQHAGLVVTSHVATTLNTALFTDVRLSGGTSTADLLTHGDFEAYAPPALGAPGWISDHAFRQVPAKSETHQPRSGSKNGACWTTGYLDCGMYQDVTAPATGTYTLRIYASADRSGGMVGANVRGVTVAARDVEVRPFGDYREYTLSFSATTGDAIRVWMYSPARPGYVVIDDARLTAVP